MQLYALGISHQTAPLALRTQAAFAAEAVLPALQKLREQFTFAKEVALVSTCNRTEIYCASQASLDDTIRHLVDWWSVSQGIQQAALMPYVYARVASGLDSMVLGESQILGQMKQAMGQAQEAGSLGLLLHHLFEQTFSVAKAVRTHTELGAHTVSMSSTCVKLSQRIFDDFSDVSVLLIGAGEMIQHCAAHFHAQHPKALGFANRTHLRAEALAQQYPKAHTCSLQAVPANLGQYDVVIACTGSRVPLIGKGAVQQVLKQRKYRPMVLIDLAVPRNIDVQAQDFDDVFVYTIDDLGMLISQGMMLRHDAVSSAEVIIDDGVSHFMQWWQQRQAVPMIQQFLSQADVLRQSALQQANKRLVNGEPPAQVLDLLSQQLTKKILHGALHLLQHGTADEREQLLKLLPKLTQTHR
jgi:glutamyl-tRNA reductase